MLVPKKNQIAIYELLFKEGVMVTKMDIHMPKHPKLADKNMPNLHVMKAMQSFILGRNSPSLYHSGFHFWLTATLSYCKDPEA